MTRKKRGDYVVTDVGGVGKKLVLTRVVTAPVSRAALTREDALRAVKATGGNRTAAARALGIERKELLALLGEEEKRGRGSTGRPPKVARPSARVLARARKGRSRSEAARILGVNESTLRGWEK